MSSWNKEVAMCGIGVDTVTNTTNFPLKIQTKNTLCLFSTENQE